MRSFDLTPLYRSAIGVDRLVQMFDSAQLTDAQPSYPPYNVELAGEDQYRVTMAVAGFTRAELDVEVERDTLKVVGRKQKEEGARTYLHRGIGARSFEHRFQLADHVEVSSATLDSGLLHIDLVRRVPEAMKPRKVVIDGGDNVAVLERRAS